MAAYEGEAVAMEVVGGVDGGGIPLSPVPLMVVVGDRESDKKGRSGDNVCCGLCR